MKTTADEAALFRAECLYWQEQLNLKHWTLQFKTAASKSSDEAETDYDCETRHATIVYYLDTIDSYHPADVALHEMLHLFMADMLLAGVEAKHEDDRILGREEHKCIVVLMPLLSRGRPKK